MASNNHISCAPDNCQWNNTLFAALKKSTTGQMDDICLCLDGCALNAVIQNKLDSNLPGICHILDCLGPDLQWMTASDLADNYHQFLLNEIDQIKTAFTCDSIQYMQSVSPFGLNLLSDHTQCLMKKNLGPNKSEPFKMTVLLLSVLF